jgi:hypothetical protein
MVHAKPRRTRRDLCDFALLFMAPKSGRSAPARLRAEPDRRRGSIAVFLPLVTALARLDCGARNPRPGTVVSFMGLDGDPASCSSPDDGHGGAAGDANSTRRAAFITKRHARLEPRYVEVLGIARDQSQVVMQRCRGEQAIDGREGPLGRRLQSSPGICDGRIDRQEALPEPGRQFVLEPIAQLFSPLARGKLLDAASQLAKREHAQVQRLIANFLKTRAPRTERVSGETSLTMSSDQEDTSPRDGVRSGAQGRNRTADTRIFSPLLYQLSYLGRPRERGAECTNMVPSKQVVTPEIGNHSGGLGRARVGVTRPCFLRSSRSSWGCRS